MKGKTKRILVVVDHRRHSANGLLLCFEKCIDLLPIVNLRYSKSPDFLCCDRAWQSKLQSDHSNNWVLAPLHI